MAETRKHYPVIIAGAGPVGLSLAIELAYRGVRSLVVEQSDGSVEFPTTNLANTRTCEHLRRWGIADKMRYESGYPTDYPRNYLFVTRMDGYEIARFDHADLNADALFASGRIPTTENLVRACWDLLAPKLGAERLHRLRLWEDPTFYVEYFGA